ncbi:hypothetical protein ACFXK0_22910 [Nocardia sp. NPDC059177]|uniref:hypothetical protein n=1 Tax=Nocardia sp. NPDC059177 TaxID=3346759 RepID=UPI0036AEC1EE
MSTRSPFASGYQGARCAAVDSAHDPIPLDRHDSVGRLTCNGDRDPVERMTVSCNRDRTPRGVRPFEDSVTVLEQTWERESGRGRLLVQDGPGVRPGTTAGALTIQFDDPARNFCLVVVIGAANGAELYDRWWPGAPL